MVDARFIQELQTELSTVKAELEITRAARFKAEDELKRAEEKIDKLEQEVAVLLLASSAF